MLPNIVHGVCASSVMLCAEMGNVGVKIPRKYLCYCLSMFCVDSSMVVLYFVSIKYNCNEQSRG